MIESLGAGSGRCVATFAARYALARPHDSAGRMAVLAEGGMAGPFTIHVNSISARPLPIDETAEKYGLPSHELRRLESFAIKR